MDRPDVVIRAFLLSLFAVSCGGSSSGPAPRPPDDVQEAPVTYSIAVTDIDVVKKGSDERIAIDNLPGRGATLTED